MTTFIGYTETTPGTKEGSQTDAQICPLQGGGNSSLGKITN